MCGIVGYVGNKQAAPILLDGLRKLEYRGYDSAGMACIAEGMEVRKDIGKIDEVNKKVKFKEIKGKVGIAHSRWATHGRVTSENAHPQLSYKNKFSVIHNGIIENHEKLRKKLKNIKFKSETDTEVIANLVEHNYQGNLKDAVIKSFSEINGAYAVGIISIQDPNVIIAARNESPLIIGVGKNENFIASDVPAILAHTKNVMYLDNKEIAIISKSTIEVYKLSGKKVNKKIHKINWTSEQTSKGGYKHFMLKEILEQPSVVSETCAGRIGDGSIDLKELDKLNFSKINKIIIIGCGTSWHAGITGKFMIEGIAGVNVEVDYASEFRYRNPIVGKNTILIAISQSGETSDTLAAIKEAKNKKIKIISIVNVIGSSISRESDFVLYTRAGPEIGVASTKAFTAQLVMLYLFTCYLAKKINKIGQVQINNRIRDLRLLPMQIQSIFSEKENIEKLANLFYHKNNALYLGRGINFPIALEGALKLKEVSYIHAEGYPAAEMKHGPIALIDDKMPVVFIATRDNKTYKKIVSNIEEVKARHGEVIAIATKGDKQIGKKVDHVLLVPNNSYILSPILSNIPLQLFAYHIAVIRKLNPDMPKNLAKSVTVE